MMLYCCKCGKEIEDIYNLEEYKDIFDAICEQCWEEENDDELS